jgi:hypothetical protein
LRIGEAYGDVDALIVQREMIRRTIKERLDKEKMGIKVLSLFFIDAVDRYRKYDGEGNPVKGDYAAGGRAGGVVGWRSITPGGRSSSLSAAPRNTCQPRT